MKVNNQKFSTRAKIFLIRLPLMITLVVLVLVLFQVFTLPALLIGSAAVFLLCLLATLILRLHYAGIEISDEQISIKYYHLFPLIREFKRIEIERKNLHSASLEKRLSGRIIVLILSETTADGNANYPEIPLSFFTKEQISEIKQALSL